MLTTAFPSGNKIIPKATPLHISQLVYHILKYSFANQADTYPFKWSEDINLTGLVFDTVFNKEAESYGKKPLVICNSGPMTTSQVVMGDVADKSVLTGNSMKTTAVQSSVIIRIISRQHAEVEILKNEIFNCLVAIRTIIPAYTNVHMVNNISAEESRKFTLDENMYIGAINMMYVMQYVWEHDIVQNIMGGINIVLNETFGVSLPTVPLPVTPTPTP